MKHPTMLMRLFTIISLLLSVALLVASSPVDSDERSQTKWENYKSKHDKNYPGAEDSARKLNFLKVDALIQANNNDANSSYRMVHNKFSDLHEHEIQSLLGSVPPPNYAPLAEEVELSPGRAAPTSLDLRSTTKCVGPVKNQGQCGSCWAFAAIAPLEFSYCMKHGKSYVSLSEQQLVDCDRNDLGCSGGWPHKAYSYLKSAGGSQLTSSYPYRGVNQNCGFSKSKVKAVVASYGAISSSSTSIVNALVQYGVLSVCLQVTSRFMSYSSGIFSDSSCTCTSSNCPVNHCVANVGYGRDKSSGKDYWIIRNSWGSGWGNKGYMLMQKGAKMCGVENYVTRVTAL